MSTAKILAFTGALAITLFQNSYLSAGDEEEKSPSIGKEGGKPTVFKPAGFSPFGGSGAVQSKTESGGKHYYYDFLEAIGRHEILAELSLRALPFPFYLFRFYGISRIEDGVRINLGFLY